MTNAPTNPGRGDPTLAEDVKGDWPAKFGSWAERAPDVRTLCRTVREVPWRLRPPDAAAVADVLREAGARGAGLWPVSRGCNWGYGSHLPARSGSVLLDLSRLDAIGDLDRPSLSVRIEPGVSQIALYRFLEANAPDLAFNVTGAGSDTSVLGNALERGIGYNGEKDLDLYALEVLLPDGSRVAPSAERNHRSRSHPAGLSTDSLFYQTNFGVVVGGRLRLRFKQEAEDAVVLQGEYAAVVETLRRAYADHVITRPTHISEPGRAQRLGFGLLRALWNRDPTPGEIDRIFPEKGTYNGLVPLYGRRSVVDASWRELKRQAVPGVVLQRGSARVVTTAATWLARVGARYQAARLRALRPLMGLIWGEPSDVGLTSLDHYNGGNPDLAGRGAIYGNAVSSVSPQEGLRAAGIIRGLWKDCAFTWILLDCRCMLTIYTLHFDDTAAPAVHEANARIVRDLRSAGFTQYRLDVETPAPRGAEAVTALLKKAFDPAGIIAPGKYAS